MDGSKGIKRKFEENTTDSDSDKSIQSYVHLGDIGNTMSDSSTNDTKLLKIYSSKRKKIATPDISKHDHSSISETSSDDCKIIDYQPPPVHVGEIEHGDTLYQNQLQDPRVPVLDVQENDYDADVDDDKQTE